jgi:hypothetical protein
VDWLGLIRIALFFNDYLGLLELIRFSIGLVIFLKNG